MRQSTTMKSVTVNGTEAVLTSYMRLLYRGGKRPEGWKIYDEAYKWLNE